MPKNVLHFAPRTPLFRYRSALSLRTPLMAFRKYCSAFSTSAKSIAPRKCIAEKAAWWVAMC
jgi:hypothetical protein